MWSGTSDKLERVVLIEDLMKKLQSIAFTEEKLLYTMYIVMWLTCHTEHIPLHVVTVPTCICIHVHVCNVYCFKTTQVQCIYTLCPHSLAYTLCKGIAWTTCSAIFR